MKLQVQGTAWWEIAAVAYAFGPRWGNPFRHFAVFVFNVFTQAFQVLLISEVGDTSIAAWSFLEMFHQKGGVLF